MAKPLKKAIRRLETRKANKPKKVTNMYNEPGSMTKPYPKGDGRRTKSQIKAASQTATNR